MRPNPKIDAQRTILQEVLALKPHESEFDQNALQDWQRIGMGPRFYLYNGIAAYARIIEERLAKLDEEEKAWQAQRESEAGS